MKKKVLKGLALSLLTIFPLGIGLAGCGKDKKEPELPNPEARIVIDNIVYEGIDDKKEYRCIGFENASTVSSLVIPDVIGQLPVTEISNEAFELETSLTSLKLGDNIKLIGQESFSKCYNLTDVKIGKGLSYIGVQAFSENPNITNIEVDDANTTFRDENEAIISKIEITRNEIVGKNEIAIKTHPANTLFVGTKASTTIPNGVVKIADRAFYGVLKNKTSCEITMPASIKEIGSYSFYRCPSISKINFANGSTLNKIEQEAFYVETADTYAAETEKTINPSLTSLDLPNTVNYVNDKAFANQTNLQSVDLGNNIKNIGDEAFANANKLTSLTFGSYLKSVGKSAFKNCDITNIEDEIPLNLNYNLTYLGDYAFANNANLKNVKIGRSLETIGSGAFDGCEALEIVDFTEAETLKNINEKAFNKTNLKSVELPESVKTIGNNAFSNTKNLERVALNKGLTSIGKGAFAQGTEGSNLTSVWIPNTVTTILASEGADDNENCPFWNNTNLKDIYLEIGSSNIPSGWNTNWNKTGVTTNVAYNTVYNDYKSETTPEPEDLVIVNGIKYEKIDGKKEYAVAGVEADSNLIQVIIPDEIDYIPVTQIKTNAFSGNEIVQSLTIGNNVETIGTKAFYGCTNLKTVIIGEKVANIESEAFANCPNLNRIIVEAENETFYGNNNNVYRKDNDENDENDEIVIEINND